jgi:hypothetical protein
MNVAAIGIDIPQQVDSSLQALSDHRLGREVPVFISKVFEIFSTKEFNDVCSWSAFGDKIIIKKVADFSSCVLPKYFKHSNFNSFVRQLNMYVKFRVLTRPSSIYKGVPCRYDFRKTAQDPNRREFQHQQFKRGRLELLRMIKRKKTRPRVRNPGGEIGVDNGTPRKRCCLTIPNDVKKTGFPNEVRRERSVIFLPECFFPPLIRL